MSQFLKKHVANFKVGTIIAEPQCIVIDSIGLIRDNNSAILDFSDCDIIVMRIIGI